MTLFVDFVLLHTPPECREALRLQSPKRRRFAQAWFGSIARHVRDVPALSAVEIEKGALKSL
eukprot:1053541-Prorocentrum_minimum.AAC.2